MHTIASGILFAGYESLWVEKAPVCTGLKFDDIGFQINVKGTWHMFTKETPLIIRRYVFGRLGLAKL